jgi:F-type H+-transporting ATP synthase subunit e
MRARFGGSLASSPTNQYNSFDLQVLRYSALLGGLFYGVWHQSTLNAQAKDAEKDREYKHKESLIQQAKAEWLRKNPPPPKNTGRMLRPNEFSLLYCRV